MPTVLHCPSWQSVNRGIHLRYLGVGVRDGGRQQVCAAEECVYSVRLLLLLSNQLSNPFSATSLPSYCSCHFLRPNDPGFLYCHPPPERKPTYGSCGDCHCINRDKPCPSDPKDIPLTNVPDDWLKQLKQMDATNPYEMVCNPYNTTNVSLFCVPRRV